MNLSSIIGPDVSWHNYGPTINMVSLFVQQWRIERSNTTVGHLFGVTTYQTLAMEQTKNGVVYRQKLRRCAIL